jgi:leader peptidase (prepilin peptidase)/N-methyltransferase
MAFLGPAAALAMLGWYLGKAIAAGGTVPLLPSLPPLWLEVLGGVLIGYLVGGGIVWGVRILGSIAFGKEAMGLGDVHLMAAVGACLGWIDATLAFFGAAFVGLAWTLLGVVFSGAFQRAMPYGPYLAVATGLVLLCKPALEAGLALVVGGPVNIP